MGPVVTAAHRQKILDYIATGIAEGATLVCDGRRHLVPGRENGFFLGATLFDRAQANMQQLLHALVGHADLVDFRPLQVIVHLALARDRPVIGLAHALGDEARGLAIRQRPQHILGY